MGEMVWDLIGEDTNEHGLPPGFRFHPTDEELITFYLASKVYNGGGSCSFCSVQIVEVDLNRCEPWELPEIAKLGEKEWYFYSLKDRKYPTGLRTNRATGAGYWKATGKDREIHSVSNGGSLVGMKKTLVFYKGRAPRGEKTKWVLHEYRLDGDFSNHKPFKEEWVICRIFHKAVMEKKNPFFHHNMINCFPNPSSSFPFLPPLMEMQESPIQALLQNNPYYCDNHGDEHHQYDHCPNEMTSLPANLTSLLKSHRSNHCNGRETTVPSVPKQCNLQTLNEEAVLVNWVDQDYSNNFPEKLQNPFIFDMGHFNFNSNLLDVPFSIPFQQPPLPVLGESLPLVP